MNDLAERYVWAVAKRLSKDVGADVAEELRATIADMVEARGGGEDDVRQVLVELGDPAELAANYSGRPRHLIGPGLYPAYVRILTTLLLVVVPIVLVVTLFTELWDPVDGVALGVLAGLQAAVQTLVMIAFLVTLIFVVVERAGAGAGAGSGAGAGAGAGEARGRGDTAWDPDSLPPAADVRQISRGESIASLVFLALLLAWLVTQRSHSVFRVDGEPVPLLDDGLWDAWVPVFIAVVVASMAIEVWKYLSAVWTLPLVAANVAANVAFATVVVGALGTQRVVTPAFEAALEARTGEEFPGDVTAAALAAFVVVICLWDSVECVLKYRRRRRAVALGAGAEGSGGAGGATH